MQLEFKKAQKSSFVFIIQNLGAQKQSKKKLKKQENKKKSKMMGNEIKANIK